MDRVFVYWDNSNIFHAAQRLAGPREGPDARYRVRVDFDNLLQLAHADRPLERAVAAGSIPPEMRHLWNWMESRGIEVKLFDRGSPETGEQDMPDRLLQLRMLEDALDYNGDPGIVAVDWRRGRLPGRSGFPPHPGAHAQARLAHRNPVLGLFLQSADARLGRTPRSVRRA